MNDTSQLIGETIGGRYSVESYIGAGGMQFVYKAYDLILRKSIALKTPKNRSAEMRFKRSAVLAAKINHPNVAKTLDYLIEDESLFLVEELVNGGDLGKIILQKSELIDPYLVSKIFHRLSKGLAASHHAEVIHRDLKPSNVMVVGGFNVDELKITDFGIAKIAEEELEEAFKSDVTITGSQTAMGALPYMSPEAIESPKTVGKETDIWSLGAMMYELVSGEKPFGSGLRVVPKILNADVDELPSVVFSKPQFKALNVDLTNVILECLQRSPEDRPSADELVGLCETLCYPTNERLCGVVEKRDRGYGFISGDNDENIFFHSQSVYGDDLNVGDRVVYAKHQGLPYPRAHPVFKLLD